MPASRSLAGGPPGLLERLRRWLVADTTSGVLLLIAAAIALAWANSPWRAAYADLAGLVVGPSVLHLDLSLADWAADGLLAVFFFVVGVELKHELVAGSLRDPRQAALPALAAVGGMLAPAVVYAAFVIVLDDPAALAGWAIPTATDIAFALAVLAVFGRGLPRALRTFLLTLAVVDDLLAILVIACFYTDRVDPLALAAAGGAIVLFAVLVRRRRVHWWLLVPVALLAWGWMHASGVHATIAGVLLGLSVPAKPVHGEPLDRSTRFGELLAPVSCGIALPLFAFFAAGVTVGDDGGIAGLAQPMVFAIVAALVIGKLVGVLGTVAIVIRCTPLRLPESLDLRRLLPIGLLTGMGFTVALLVAELSFEDPARASAAKLAVLVGSALAATLGAIVLRLDARRAA